MHSLLKPLAALAVTISLASAAFAQTTFTAAGPIASTALQGNAANTTLTFNETSNYRIDTTVNFSATLTSVLSDTWASEARIRVSNSGGFAGVLQPSTIGATFTSQTFSNSALTFGSITGPRTISAGSTWSLEFFDSFDDGAGADSNWTNLSMSTTAVSGFVPPTAPSSTNLGNLSTQGTSLSFTTGAFAAGQIKWFQFTAPAISSANGRFLDMFTSALTGGFTDTEFGLYDANGDLIATDDDDDAGNFSAMSFGRTTPTRPANGTGVAFDGRDGALGGGTYYLALGAFNTTFGTAFSVTSTGAANASGFGVTLNNNFGSTAAVAPEPGTLTLIAFGALGAIAVRRRCHA